MEPTECTPAMACPGIQAPTPLVAALAAPAKVLTPLAVGWAPLRVVRYPPARVPVEAWVTVALPGAWGVTAAALEERAAADMVNSRSRYRLD
jgi:hypothetical protein